MSGGHNILLEPALDRRPATEAVAIMEPPDESFSLFVFIIAGAAYFAARKTLWTCECLPFGNTQC
jgi:hypothetical protein